MLVSLVAPGAPARPEHSQPVRATEHVVRVRPFLDRDGILRLPSAIPAHAQHLDDPPAAYAGPAGVGVAGGSDGPPNGLLAQILNFRPAAQPHPQEKPVAPASPAPSQLIRLRGGDVRLAHPIYRVEPRYPQIAVKARVSGPVELEGIIGTDGRIRDLHALSGNPLLVPAAIEAVRQWVYEPTLLNGKPVEVIAPITVIFRLTQ
jgi:protein TonB